MTNREKLLKMNTYDLLMKLWLKVHCPIEVLGFPVPKCPPAKDYIHADCEQCIQRWLNEEATT